MSLNLGEGGILTCPQLANRPNGQPTYQTSGQPAVSTWSTPTSRVLNPLPALFCPASNGLGPVRGRGPGYLAPIWVKIQPGRGPAAGSPSIGQKFYTPGAFDPKPSPSDFQGLSERVLHTPNPISCVQGLTVRPSQKPLSSDFWGILTFPPPPPPLFWGNTGEPDTKTRKT